MISNRQAWIWIGVLLLFIIFFSFFAGSPHPKEYPAYVSHSPSPTGTKAVYTYLEHHNNAVSRWSHSPSLLPNLKNQLLVMIEPYFVPQKEEMKAYIDFMNAGNTILLFSENPKGMFDVETVHMDVNRFEAYFELSGRDGAKYQAKVSSRVRLETVVSDEILQFDELGTLAFKRSYGEGYLIVSNSPQWIRNDTLLEADHVSLVLSLIDEANGKLMMFDEYVHGQENAPTVTTLYPQWFLLWMLQGILLTILWLWHRGKRFGPVLEPREEFVRFSDEGIRALAAWHLRGRRYHDSVVIQADAVKLLIQEKWRIPYGKEWEDITLQLERKWKKSSTEIQSFIKSLNQVLQQERISKQEYLLWSKKLDHLRKEVEEG